MLTHLRGVKIYAHCCTWCEAYCSLLHMVWGFLLVALHGVKEYAH